MKRVVLALLVALAVLLPTTPALAASDVFHTSFKGQFVRALFDRIDASGCIQTFVDVFAIDRKDKIDGPPAVTSEAVVFIDVVDQCAPARLVSAIGSAIPDDFVMQSLDSATLDTSIEMFDFVSGTTFTVDVSVTWTGVGDPSRTQDHSQTHSPGFKLISRSDGTFRDSTAGGTVSDGTTNFTPNPAFAASLAEVKSGEVTVVKQ